MDIIDGLEFNTSNLYFIDLLKAIVICDNKPLYNNQIITSKIFFKETNYQMKGFFLSKSSEGEIIVVN